MMPAIRLAFVLSLSGGLTFALAQQPAPTDQAKPDPALAYQNEIGYTALKTRLKEKTPTGAGVWLMQVEPNVAGAGKPGQYRPDLKQVFDKERTGFQLNVPGTESGLASGHATPVSQYLFGKYSVATGVTRVELITPDTEFLPQWLGFPNREMRTATELPKISSHSYVDSTSRPDLVRRLDDFINKTGHLAVVAVGKNTMGDPVEPTFGASYNALVIGLSNGQAAYGLTKEDTDGPGRTKPDLVVPAAQTSIATPIAAGAVALLVEAAGHNEEAVKPVVLKAVLLAGANKKFQSVDFAGGWVHVGKMESPLHPKFGAGQLDIDASHRILTAGRQKPGLEQIRKELDGWGRDAIEPKAEPLTYYFDVPDERVTTSLTAAMTWNRSFADAGRKPLVPKLEMTLGMVDESGSFTSVIDRSAAAVDNVNIIWHTGTLKPGRYGIRIANPSDVPSEFAVAWSVATKAAPGMKKEVGGNRPLSRSVDMWIYIAIAVGIVVFALILYRLRRMF
jgi:hypothetical protein